MASGRGDPGWGWGVFDVLLIAQLLKACSLCVVTQRGTGMKPTSGTQPRILGEPWEKV